MKLKLECTISNRVKRFMKKEMHKYDVDTYQKEKIYKEQEEKRERKCYIFDSVKISICNVKVKINFAVGVSESGQNDQKIQKIFDSVKISFSNVKVKINFIVGVSGSGQNG